MKLFLVKLDKDAFRAYHGKGQGGSVMAPLVKESVDNFVERMRLIGYEAFVLPECQVEFIGPQPEDVDDATLLVPVITIDIATLPPASARSVIEQAREAFKGHPSFQNAVFLTRGNDGRGITIDMLKI